MMIHVIDTVDTCVTFHCNKMLKERRQIYHSPWMFLVLKHGRLFLKMFQLLHIDKHCKSKHQHLRPLMPIGKPVHLPEYDLCFKLQEPTNATRTQRHKEPERAFPWSVSKLKDYKYPVIELNPSRLFVKQSFVCLSTKLARALNPLHRLNNRLHEPCTTSFAAGVQPCQCCTRRDSAGLLAWQDAKFSCAHRVVMKFNPDQHEKP